MNETQLPYSRDELLRSRDQTLTTQDEGSEGPDYLLLPHSLLDTEAAATTFEEEALCALLQLRGRSLTFGGLVQMAESLDLGTQDHRQTAWAKSARGAASRSEKAHTIGVEGQDGHHPVNRNCSLEHWLRASLRRRPDLFHVDCDGRLQRDTQVSLASTVPLRYFQIPLINILNPNALPVPDSPQAHLKWMCKALASKKRYLALFDQEDLSDEACRKLHSLVSSQDALINAVYGHIDKKVACVSRPAGRRGDAARRLVKAFQQHVEEDGYFSSQAVLAEMEIACQERRLRNPLDLLQDKEVGSIFMTLMKIQLFIDTTIWTTFALLPIVTFYDLERMILKGTDFQHLQQHGYRFQRSGFGNLVYHPAVRANLCVVKKEDPFPPEFPEITSEQLLNLMVEGWLKSDGSFEEKTFENTWSVEAGLIHAAKCLNLPDYGHIGVRVQRENLVKVVVKQVLQRRSNLMKHINNVIKRESEAGHIGCGFEWATEKCQLFFQALSSLKSASEQLRLIREFLLRELSTRQDLDAIEKIVAPLLLVATSAAHVVGSNGSNGKERDQGEQGDFSKRLAITVQQLQDLLPSGRSLQDVVDASKDKSSAKAFLKCERELVQLCGLSHASDLPLSLAELMELRPELAANLTSTEHQNAAEQNPSCLCPSVENEQIVFQYFESTLHMNALAKGNHSLTWLLETVGLCEDEICRQGNVSNFSEFSLNYGNFLARNASDIAALLDGRFTTSQSPLSIDLASVCERLKAKGCNAMEAKWAIRGHFASAISDVEADTAWDRVTDMADVHCGSMVLAWVLVARGHSPKPGQITSVERQQLILNAIEQIASAPFLMDLRMTVDWEEMFQPILGELDIFLSSQEFVTAWESQTFTRDSHIICLRWQHFVRLPLGPAMFRKALAADDPVAAAAFVLSKWLQDCRNFSCDQYMDLVEDHLLRKLQGNAKEIFVLHAISVLPKEWRDSVAPVFAKAYMKLALPKSQMISMAKLRPEWTLALRWFARFACHRDWELKWEEFYSNTGIWGLQEKVPEKLDVERPTTLKATRRPETEKSEGSISDSDPESSEDDQMAPATDEDSENRRLCREIARNKGVKLEDIHLTGEWKPPVNKVYRSLQNTVRKAVERLAEELYSAEVHFVLELLQNADDCEFPEGVVPSLTVTFEHDPNKLGEWTSFQPAQPPAGVLIVEHNEVGFCDLNVIALCDLGHSTKVGSRKFIGAKGIGFKSTFCATSTPIVHSGMYHFHFNNQALNGLGYLIPFPLQRPSSFSSGTRIVLPIYDETKVALCRRVVEDLRPELLLFLRKLAKITIADRQAGIEKTIQMHKASNDEVRLDTSTTSGPSGKTEDYSSVWHVHRRPVSLPRAATGSESTDLQIAFRQNDKNEQLPAFAWLPLRSYGFRFIVQADWEVSSSREAILAERSRNQCLRSSLPEIFCELVEELAAKALTIPEDSERDSAFRTLYNLIPLRNETVEFFADSSRSILEGLKSRQFILVRAGSSQMCVTPAEVVRKELDSGIEAVLKSDIKDFLEPILNTRKLFFEKGLLSCALARDLEIPNLDKSIAFKTLEALSSEQRQSLSDDLLEAIHLLLRILASANVNQSVIDKMKTLYIIPTQNGKLCSSNDNVYIVDETTANTLQGYAEGLNLQFRQTMHRDVEHFLRRLGVRQTDSARFLKEILIPMLTADEALDRDQLIDVTQRTLRCLSFFKSSESRHQFVKDLRKAMWVVVDSFDRKGCQTVRLAETDVHISALPLPLQREWQGRNWWCVSSLYGSDGDCSLSWNDFWKDLGCWPLLCMKEHAASQLTLSTSPDFVDIIETLNVMKSKSGSVAYDASLSLVQWFVQHSQHASCYSKYFPSKEDSDGAMQNSGTFASIFCSSAWLPAAKVVGGVVSHRLLSLKEGWIRESDQNSSSNPLLASACFHHDVGQLAKAWTFLNFSRGKPDAVALVQILKVFGDSHHRFSQANVVEFYDLLKEQITKLSAEQEETEIRRFLQKEAWIFLPDRRDRRKATQDYWREFQGKFFAAAELANQDSSALFCTWKKQVTDEMAEIATEAARKQCIEKYYPLPLKRFFEDWGVHVRISWDAYLQVLHAVDQRVRANTTVSSKEAAVLPEVVLRVMAALGTSRGDNREIDEDDHDPDDCPEAREDGMEMDSEKQLLQRFISEAQQLRVVHTARSDFRTPAEVIFYATADNLWDWSEAAQHFVAKIPNLKGPWVGGFEALGLRSTSEVDRICIVPSRSVEEQETKLARAIFLAAGSHLFGFE